MTSPASKRLGFADLIDRLSAQEPRRDSERILFDDVLPELRKRKIGAIRLPGASENLGASGSRLPLTEVLASHNPTIYKHQVLGAYELHGTRPPLDVYF
jgi:hypothetical protein